MLGPREVLRKKTVNETNTTSAYIVYILLRKTGKYPDISSPVWLRPRDCRYQHGTLGAGKDFLGEMASKRVPGG